MDSKQFQLFVEFVSFEGKLFLSGCYFKESGLLESLSFCFDFILGAHMEIYWRIISPFMTALNSARFEVVDYSLVDRSRPKRGIWRSCTEVVLCRCRAVCRAMDSALMRHFYSGLVLASLLKRGLKAE